MLNLSSLVKTIKPISRMRSAANEVFLNCLLSPVVEAGRVRNKNGDEFDLDKTRTSKILQQKADVPLALRAVLEQYQIRDKIRDGMSLFIEDAMEHGSESDLRDVLVDYILDAENLSEEKKAFLLQRQDDVCSLLTDVLITAIEENNLAEEKNHIIFQNGANCVFTIIGDLFKFGFGNRRREKNIIVIPVDATFETHLSRNMENDPAPLISPNTIHGQWLFRWEQAGNSILELDKRIEESLSARGIVSDMKSPSPSGKQKCYPIGSVAAIETGNAVYYLLSISTLDEHNVARSSKDEIQRAIKALVEYYDSYGQGYTMYLPLIGTGRSRTGLGLQEAYELITSVLRDNNDHIHGNINIVLNAEAAKQILL